MDEPLNEDEVAGHGAGDGQRPERGGLEGMRQFAKGTSRLVLRDDLLIGEIDSELVVLDASGEVVHRVTGDGVDAVRLLQSGVAEDLIPDRLIEAVDALAQMGLVSGRGTLSRRKMIAAGGATWVAATVTTFVLADPAAAWSICRNGKVPTANDSGSTGKKYTSAGTYTWVSGPSGFHTPNTQQNLTKLVRAWGGGGSGGKDQGTFGGGGGGGGAYVHANISVLECTEYTVVVGSGGTGNSVNGSASTFGGATTLKAAGGAKGNDEGNSGGAGGAIADCVPTTGSTRFAGGNGSTGGSYNLTGCGGGSAGSTGNGGNATGSAGGSAGSGTPGGAAGGAENTAGSAPGGGGGGGDSVGANGAPGAVWIGV